MEQEQIMKKLFLKGFDDKMAQKEEFLKFLAVPSLCTDAHNGWYKRSYRDNFAEIMILGGVKQKKFKLSNIENNTMKIFLGRLKVFKKLFTIGFDHMLLSCL